MAINDLNSFSRRIDILADRVEENADKLVRKVALAADQAVVSGTPVDKGRARSNWIVTINSPATETIDAYSEGSKGSTGEANITAATSQAESVISGYRNGDEIHITNNLTYIGRLNDGYSRQAPANFVETAALEAANAVRNARLTDGGT